jgi:glycosyltransferase involved in cell wall biosynthesis
MRKSNVGPITRQRVIAPERYLWSVASLSIVICVYNEPRWIGQSISDAALAAERSGFDEVELVVVDDGSDADTQRALAHVDVTPPVRVIHQQNQGRFGARRTGVEAARGELVLLLDARVSLAPDALRFIADRLDGELPIWNGHVEIDVEGNPYARFWRVITALAFRRYLADPRTTSFGLEEFDAFPKGTGCFLAPRAALLEAIASFRSHYADLRNVSDDTALIRLLAAHQRINISPGFACIYRSRDAFRPFMHHAFHRGKMFVDTYGRPGARFFPLVVALYPLSAGAAAIAVRRPRRVLMAGAAAPLAFATGALALRAPRADVAAVTWVGPNWLLAFAAGMWYGLWLALRNRASR